MSRIIAIWRLAGQPSGRSEPVLEPVHLSPSPSSLDDASAQLPGGAYTTFRTFGRRRMMRLCDHFDRLEETAQLAGHTLRLDRARVEIALGHALDDYPSPDARVRMTLDLQESPGVIYILVDELHTPSPEDYLNGVRVVTRELQRHNPKAKLTGFIETASAIRQTLPAGINEALMIGADGHVLEGLSSNFFGIKDGVVWTAEQGVLSGITRSLVLEAIHELGIPLRLEGLPEGELLKLDEAFITSASRAVLPVREIDGRPMGHGCPGPLTLQLSLAYQIKVEARLETVGETVS